jgi:hypothetical protein
MIEQPAPVFPSESLITDYASAPQPRQEEILKFLVSMALDAEQSDIVQQNAYNGLLALEAATQNPVKLRLAAHLQSKIGRKGLDLRMAKVARAAGAFPFLRQSDIADFFEAQHQEMQKIGAKWRAHNQHGDLLRSFREGGGLRECPATQRRKIMRYLVLTYLGEPGRMTNYGNVRDVFYSNTAAPLIEELIRDAAAIVIADLKELRKEEAIDRACRNRHIDRRFETLLDFASAAA